MKDNFRFLGLLTFLVLPLAGQSIVYRDGDFKPEDWSQPPLVFQEKAGGRANYQRSDTGGQPEAHVRITLFVEDESKVVAVLLNNRAVYRPAIDGPLTAIDYSEDARFFEGKPGGSGHETGPALRQGGRIYVYRTLFTETPNVWKTVSRNGITSAAFVELKANDSRGIFDPSSRPDFTDRGGDITFGYWRGRENSSSDSEEPYYPGGFLTFTGGNRRLIEPITVGIGLDNWSVTLRRSARMEAEDDSFIVAPGRLASIEALLQNDRNVPAGTQVELVSNTTLGTLELRTDRPGSFTYNAPPGEDVIDRFTYRLRNSSGTSNPATVTLRTADFLSCYIDGSYTIPFEPLPSPRRYRFTLRVEDVGSAITGPLPVAGQAVTFRVVHPFPFGDERVFTRTTDVNGLAFLDFEVDSNAFVEGLVGTGATQQNCAPGGVNVALPPSLENCPFAEFLARLWFAAGAFPNRTPNASDVASRLPLSFERIPGAKSPFVARGPGYMLAVKSDQAELYLPGSEPIRMRFPGARSNAPARTLEPRSGRINYVMGRDPGKWRAGVLQYGRVRFEQVYPGVDVVYYGKGGKLEYDLIVSPGADPSNIRLQFDGVDRLSLSTEGSLNLVKGGAEMKLDKPVVYQATPNGRRAIAAEYVLTGSGGAGFKVGEYDPSEPLVIDPVLSYGTYFGGGANDISLGVALDAQGNAYLTGSTFSADLATRNPLPGGGKRGSPTTMDTFVTKLNADGTGVVYSTYFGGTDQDLGLSIAVDSAGAAYVAGITRSTDFPVEQGLQRTHRGGGFLGSDAFVAKLDPSGSRLVYSTYLGGTGDEFAGSIAVDRDGNAHITGGTSSTNFPLQNPIQNQNRGGVTYNADAFVAKLNASGSTLLYSTYLGGTADDLGTSIALNGAGIAHITGVTYSDNFPTVQALQRRRLGSGDAFLTRLDAAGAALTYSTYLGGPDEDWGLAVALDQAGNMHVGGMTRSRSGFLVANAAQGRFAGPATRGFDGFVTKIGADGSTLVYSTYLGGDVHDAVSGLAIAANGDLLVTGHTASRNFSSPEAMQSQAGGLDDGFLARLSPQGAVQYRTYLGGSGKDVTYKVAVDAAGNAYVAGGSNSFDAPVAFRGLQTGVAGELDAYVVKIGPGTPPPVFTSVSGASFLTSTALAPGSLATGYGQNLASGIALAPDTTLPETLNGVSVRVTEQGGAEYRARLVAVAPTQVNYLVPSTLKAGLVSITVLNGERVLATGTARIRDVAPALFSANANGSGVAAALGLRARNEEQSTEVIFQCGTAAGSCAAAPLSLAAEDGQLYLLLFGTGIRNARGELKAKIGNIDVPVLGAAAHSVFQGLDQVNVGPLPASLAGAGEVPIVLSVDGIDTNPVTVRFR
jgi:uncharacterized protein (TIGR03437 family)